MASPVSETLYAASARKIRDRKLAMLAEFEKATGEPGDVFVRRGYDMTLDRAFATIIVRPSLTQAFRWGAMEHEI